MPKSKSKRHPSKASRIPQFLIIGGVILVVAMILVFKQDKTPDDTQLTNPAGTPELQLDRALESKQPTLAFFHSNNCQQCIVMMETVDEVYPEFKGAVTLVDVNVYDEQNAALLSRVGLQYIPTLIFFDRSGQGKVSVGVMEAETLRQTLANLAGGQ
jgi:thiol:disulfide interchange protein